MSPSDSFPVSEAEDEGAQQLLTMAKQGGIVGQRRSDALMQNGFCLERACCDDTIVTELVMCDSLTTQD